MCLRLVAQTVPPPLAPSKTLPDRARPSFAIELTDDALRLRGDLEMRDAAAIWAELSRSLATAKRGKKLELDLSGVDIIDGGVMSLVVQARAELSQRGVRAEVVGASERTQALVHLYGGDEKPARRKRRKAEGFIEQVGRATQDVLGELARVVSFFGSMLESAFGVLRNPRSGNFGEIPAIIERAGADAIPIVLLLNFLLGFVMGFQAARQLETYGASIYVADLVGISVTRELAPLMTAIIVCGRSGAAIAAELGTMRVSEEIDALRTMGFGPVRYLVLPRTLALMIVVPILTLFADIIGIIGGLVVAITTLKLSPVAYLTQSRLAVTAHDVESGLAKSVVFALAIGLIACQQGFATSGGAQGVGRRTTSTVVTSLFAIVLIDAVFTVFYRAVGI